MFTDDFPSGQALHIEPCRMIHTYFMNYPIDVLYLDSSYRIVALEEKFPPGRRGTDYRRTRSVVELPAGSIGKTHTKIGQALQFIA